VGGNPRLLRRSGRRFFRRFVFAGALAGILVVAPGASGLPAALGIQYTITGTPGTNGWYVSNVTVKWTVTGETGTQGCDTQTLTVDTPGQTITCHAWNDTPPGPPVEEDTSSSVTIRLDKTPPSVSIALERQPDANGWYNRPFTIAWAGADATSGIAGCTATRYAGPDNSNGLAAGSCTDKAGNGAGSSFPFKYDTTAPTVFAVSTKPGNRSVELSWRTSADTRLVEVLRSPGRNGQGESVVYRGPEKGIRDTGLTVGRIYEYRITGVDEAANRAEHSIKLVATGALLSPPPAAHVTSPPTLVWTPVKRASYYNLQLVRGRKVLSVWPLRTTFRLRRTWTYKGRRYRLRPGLYRWYVWPGFGRISAARYGRLLGSSTFVVTK
jgi:hypothetical protein